MTRLVSTTGTTAATYTYNAWGELVSSSGPMAAINPIRYRGYYYDTETGFYYLQSRYYDPVICRFVNADAPELSEMNGSSNLYSYCNNNPIMMKDSEGTLAFLATIGIGLVCGVIGGTINAVIAAQSDNADDVTIGLSFASGFAAGFGGAFGFGWGWVGALVAGVISAGSEVYTQHKSGAERWNDYDKGRVVGKFVSTTLTSGTANALGHFANPIDNLAKITLSRTLGLAGSVLDYGAGVGMDMCRPYRSPKCTRSSRSSARRILDRNIRYKMGYARSRRARRK